MPSKKKEKKAKVTDLNKSYESMGSNEAETPTITSIVMASHPQTRSVINYR